MARVALKPQARRQNAGPVGGNVFHHLASCHVGAWRKVPPHVIPTR
jgi:hypothetical protein